MNNDPMAPTTRPNYPNDIPPEQIEDLIASTTSLQNQVLRKFARAVLEEMRYHLWVAQEKCKIFEKDASRYAAAPELLSLAERVAALNENCTEIGHGMLTQLVTDARAAIAKTKEQS